MSNRRNRRRTIISPAEAEMNASIWAPSNDTSKASDNVPTPEYDAMIQRLRDGGYTGGSREANAAGIHARPFPTMDDHYTDQRIERGEQRRDIIRDETPPKVIPAMVTVPWQITTAQRSWLMDLIRDRETAPYSKDTLRRNVNALDSRERFERMLNFLRGCPETGVVSRETRLDNGWTVKITREQYAVCGDGIKRDGGLWDRDGVQWLMPSQETTDKWREATGSGDLGVEVADGRYALRQTDGVVRFYSVRGGVVKVQAGDDLHTLNMATQRAVAELIADDPMAASTLYGRELGCCGVCGRTLTNEDSREAGIGPVCAGRLQSL